MNVSENEVKARGSDQVLQEGASLAQENAGRWAGREQPKKEKSKEQVLVLFAHSLFAAL